ncbi:MAG: hypothetical protein UY50_C0034G0010 [Parcubacteria group bacterium GW2011_GWA2_49_9]|nr:MAG: hypothetical protein UY50_C0034G0010 [Parcubacteria group bacterium GW2011_GWA2_49_9]
MVKLEDGEEILYIARRHWFLFFSETFFLLLFAVLPLILVFIPASAFNEVFSALHVTNYGAPLFTFFWSLWLMLLWMLFALLWTNYYLDIWILTNHRIIDIEQLGLFNRHVSSFRYNQIQDATVKVSGLVETVIGFGTVEIHTASNESFKFKGVAKPNEVKERIMSEHHRVHTD